MTDPALPDLIEALDTLEEQLDRLKEQRQDLRARIMEALAASGMDTCEATVGDRPVRVRIARKTRVDYDEDVLRERLGERYALLLQPDVARIRKHLDVVEPLLGPVLDVVGAPSRHRVEQLIGAGTLAPEDFAGAFTKETVTTLYVRRKGVKPISEDDETAPY